MPDRLPLPDHSSFSDRPRFSRIARSLLHIVPAIVALTCGAAGLLPAQAAETQPLSHIPEGQLPELKNKDFNGNFALEGAAGNAVLRSRYGNDDGADGQKIYVFAYQVDLKAAYEVAGPAGVSGITLDLPKAPVIAVWPKLPGAVKFYVVDADDSDKGVAVTAAKIDGNKVTFTFATPVNAGKTPGTGDHTQWFGFITSTRPGRGPAEIITAGQTVKPPAVPSTVAGGKPADNQTSSAAVISDAPQIDVFVPMGDQPGTSQKNTDQKNGTQKNGTQQNSTQKSGSQPAN